MFLLKLQIYQFPRIFAIPKNYDFKTSKLFLIHYIYVGCSL